MNLVERPVIVVGGGIAGLCAAYYLRRAGVAVTVLEARRVGSGASCGNAGWVTPAQAGPLPEPGLVTYGLRSLFEPQAPVYFEPRQLVRMLPWLLGFARRCNEADHAQGPPRAWRAGRPVLRAARRYGVRRRRRGAAARAATGGREGPTPRPDVLGALAAALPVGLRSSDPVLGQEEIRSLEPALTGAVRAGLVIEQHRVVEPQTLLAGLARRLAELDVEIQEGTEVRDVELENARLVSLQTSAGRYRCDQVVLAAGAWLGPLARLLEARLPVQGGKGYSFEVRPRRMPRYPLLLLEPHVGCSPFGDRLRIAGTMEFSGLNARIDRRRVQSIADGARTMIEGWESLDRDSVWCGLRPIAPDGLPMIDRHPRIGNVFFAGAYSMLGVTLAAPAAEKLAAFVLDGRRPPGLEPFRAARFRFALGRERGAPLAANAPEAM